MNSLMDEMRSIIGENSPVHAKHMSDEDILSWFKNKATWAFELHQFKRLNNLPPADKARHKRIMDCWADYCLLEEVQSPYETEGYNR